VPEHSSLDSIGAKLDSFQGETLRRFDRMELYLNQIDRDVQAQYVSKDEFLPVKILVYGMASTIMLSFLGMLLYYIGWAHK
jgi:hypothetical protein